MRVRHLRRASPDEGDAGIVTAAVHTGVEGEALTGTWPDLEVSKSAVRRAGEVLRRWYVGELVSESDVAAAQEFLANWRGVHGFVRNTAAMGLRSRAGRLGLDAEVASRTKARTSIFAKLAERPDLKLDALGDIAGARAVVDDLGAQERLVRAYDDVDEVRRLLDYRDGKAGGYRAVHIDLVLEDIHTTHPDRRRRRVELQIRTRAQHDWADTVEEFGRLIRARLKQGSGPTWLLQRLATLSVAYAVLDDALAGDGDVQAARKQVTDLTREVRTELEDES